MYEEELRKILTDGETKVYLALLQIGSSTVGPIVEKSKVAYSNIYEILNRLIEKGLVSFVIKSKTKYFQASPPNNLIDFINKREKNLEENKKDINKIIPKLIDIQKQVGEKLEAEIFLGIRGLNSAYEKLFGEYKKKQEYLWFYTHDEETVELTDNFYAELYKKFKFMGKGIASKRYKIPKYLKTKGNEYKFVDFPIPSNIDIYEDVVLLISWKPQPICFYINSKDITEKMRTYFYSVWKVAKK